MSTKTFERGLNTFIVVGVIAILILLTALITAVVWSNNINIIVSQPQNNLTEFQKRQNYCMMNGILFLKPTDPNYQDYDECMEGYTE